MLLQDVVERDVALMILEVSFEILEVLISMVGQATCTADETYGGAVTECFALSYLQKGVQPPESSAESTGRPAKRSAQICSLTKTM